MENLFDVFWKEILVGRVFKQEKYYIFKYDIEGVIKAKSLGFNYIVGFKDFNQEYKSEKLFSIFSSRIPSKQRHDIEKILNDLNLNEYNEIEILKRTKGKCFTDDIETR